MSGVSQRSDVDLRRFLIVRQEFFLDLMESTLERFVDAALLLQRALFDWYLEGPSSFTGMLW
jgi:hypothetical protein